MLKLILVSSGTIKHHISALSNKSHTQVLDMSSAISERLLGYDVGITVLTSKTSASYLVAESIDSKLTLRSRIVTYDMSYQKELKEVLSIGSVIIMVIPPPETKEFLDHFFERAFGINKLRSPLARRVSEKSALTVDESGNIGWIEILG